VLQRAGQLHQERRTAELKALAQAIGAHVASEISKLFR
jgi:hypothetical protein